MGKEIILRAHHGLCVLHFVGEGYGSAFVENMKKVVGQLSADTGIRVVDEPDLICRHCPHNELGICKSEEQVQRYDAAVMRLCGIKPGTVILYGAYEERIRTQIITAGRFSEICGDCEWHPLCLKVMNIVR